MINSVMATVLRFTFLLIFQALVLPATSIDTTAFEAASRSHTTNHKSINVESHANACAIVSGVLLKEPSEAKHDVVLPNLSSILIVLAAPAKEAWPKSFDYPLTPVSFLTYLSRFSNSPPTLS